jgi:hypothetical protein
MRQRCFCAAIVCAAGAAASAAPLQQTLEEIIPATGLNLSLSSLTFQASVTPGNLASMRQSVLDNWAYPDGDVTGGAAVVRGVSNIGSQVGLDPARLADHVSFLSSSLQVGDNVYIANWSLTDPTYGSFEFSTLGYEGADGEAKFEPFAFTAPALDGSERGNRYIARTRNDPNDVNFRVRRHFGGSVAASGWGDLTLRCNNDGTIADCNALPGDSQSFLWEAKTTNDPPVQFVQNGVHCCRANFYFAFTNGFKSIEVGADGFTLSLTGSFGWGGRDSAEVVKCCEAPVPAPGPVALAAAGLVLVSGRRRART